MSELSIIFITLLFSAFFSGSEMAFLSTNNLMIELNRHRFPRLSKITDIFHKNRGLFISTILIGNNAVIVIYSLYMGDIIQDKIGQYIGSPSLELLTQTIISTFIILFTAEFIPKILFRLNPTLSLNIASVPMLFFHFIFYPFTKSALWLSNLLIKIMSKEPIDVSTDNSLIGGTDLNHLIDFQHELTIDIEDMPDEIKFFKNALDFSNIKVRECVVPRPELEAIDINDSLNDLKQKFIDTGFSKILVYRENIDNIIGYVHVSSMFKNPRKLQNILNQISIVPESMPANKLLEIFTNEHKSIVLVVDEFGGTSGIATLEDVLEEIFGEIDDEHDVSDLIELQTAENIFQFSGRFEIDYLNDKYSMDLPIYDDYETLAGLILHLTESIPPIGEIFEIEGFEFKILKASKSKIELVEIHILDK